MCRRARGKHVRVGRVVRVGRAAVKMRGRGNGRGRGVRESGEGWERTVVSAIHAARDVLGWDKA